MKHRDKRMTLGCKTMDPNEVTFRLMKEREEANVIPKLSPLIGDMLDAEDSFAAEITETGVIVERVTTAEEDQAFMHEVSMTYEFEIMRMKVIPMKMYPKPDDRDEWISYYKYMIC